MTEKEIKKGLKIWFVIHFLADVAVALPLMILPVTALKLLGWETVDPVAARIASAALFGIGIESLLGRKSPIPAFKAMLNLKIIWSATALLGFVLSLAENVHGRPAALWAFAVVFAAFHVLWVYWRIQVGRLST